MIALCRYTYEIFICAIIMLILASPPYIGMFQRMYPLQSDWVFYWFQNRKFWPKGARISIVRFVCTNIRDEHAYKYRKFTQLRKQTSLYSIWNYEKQNIKHSKKCAFKLIHYSYINVPERENWWVYSMVLHRGEQLLVSHEEKTSQKALHVQYIWELVTERRFRDLHFSNR